MLEDKKLTTSKKAGFVNIFTKEKLSGWLINIWSADSQAE